MVGAVTLLSLWGDTSFSPPVSPLELGAPSGHKGSSTGCCANVIAVISDTITDNSFLILFYFHGSLDKVEDAMTFYLKAKDVLQSSDQFKLLGLISEGIGTLNRKQKLFDTALNSYKESLTYYSLVPDSLCMTYANRNIGRVFLYKNRLDSAYYYYDKAIYISNANKYVAVGSLLLELGVIHRSEKDYIGAE